jgi:hypothetical protein
MPRRTSGGRAATRRTQIHLLRSHTLGNAHTCVLIRQELSLK